MAKLKATAENITKRISSLPSKKLGILNYDFDNLYTERCIDISNDSGTAKSCIKAFVKFVTGTGASDFDFYKAVINSKGLTIDKLIRKIAKSKGQTPGIAIHVAYNELGKITDVTPMDFETCRLTDPEGEYAEKIAVHEDWGLVKGRKKSLKLSDISFVNYFNPDPLNVFREMEEAGGAENYNGQILYWTPEGMNTYSLTIYDAVLEDMQTEAITKRFKKNTAAKSFLASHILIRGAQEEATDKDGNVIENEDGDQFSEDLIKFQGGDGAGSILEAILEGPEDSLKLEKVELQDYDGLFEFTEGSSQESIRKQFLIPAILLLNTSTGFSDDELNNAKSYYSDITNDDRLEIEEILRDIFQNFHEENICPSGDYSLLPIKTSKPIPIEHLPYYSKDEIREKNGDQPSEEKGGGETVLAVELGVGGTGALTSILTDTILTYEQKLGTIKVLFGISEENAIEMLGPKDKKGRK